jgi:hypothetical protein
MPKDESTNSTPASAETPKRRDAVFGKGSGATTSRADNGSEQASGNGRRWSAGLIAGVAAAGLGILVAAGIGGAAIGQAVDGPHHNKSESSQMRDHGKPGMDDDRDGKGGGERDGMGGGAPDGMFGDNAGPGAIDPNAPTAPVDPNAVPGDAPLTGQAPSGNHGGQLGGGDRPHRNG